MKALLASVAAIGLMGGTALAQQILLVPGSGSGDSQAAGEQRFILVPAPRFEPGSEAGSDDASMALDLYRRGYQRGMADARSGARPQIDPGAIERIGRELFERGYILGLMQAQAQTTAAETREALEGEQQPAQQQGQQQQTEQQTGQQQSDRQQSGQQSGQQAHPGQQTAGQHAAGQQRMSQATQGQDQQLVESQEPQAEDPAARIGTQTSDEFGEYLVDTTGAPVYLFEEDEQGTDGSEAVSTCTGECAEVWPPVLTRSTPVEAMGSADPDLLGTIEREDGFTQVTYNGWPLYLYVEDQGADRPTGHDVHDRFGGWYLLTPGGEQVGH